MDMPEAAGHLSYSQLGEDGTLSWMFRGKREGFYVDVGAFHPFVYSNTALLHRNNGWSGVNIDIDERAIAAFQAARPRDMSLVAAVGHGCGHIQATIFDESPAFNYLGPSNSDLDHLSHRKTSVEIVPLVDIFETYVPKGRQIDFLNIDAEGQDFAILQSNVWERFRPTVIATETVRADLSIVLALPTYAYLRERGYALISHTVCTSIFWLEDNDLGV